jgi:hypothetical protein
MSAVDPMVWGFSVYSLLLVVIGWGFDYLARRASQKTKEHHSGRFVYHADHDAWLCPEDQWLWPTSFDPENRVMRYRANPSICNSCPVKDTCTTSNHGRSISREVDQWPHSETGRFHRGIALVVALMGLVLAGSMMLYYHSPAELALLGATSVIVVAGTFPLAIFLWKSPSNFPVGVPEYTPEEDQSNAVARNRYTTYWSSRRRVDHGTVYRSDE